MSTFRTDVFRWLKTTVYCSILSALYAQFCPPTPTPLPPTPLYLPVNQANLTGKAGEGGAGDLHDRIAGHRIE